MIFEFLLSLAAILAGHYFYLLFNKDYWKKRGVFCPKSDSLIGSLPGHTTGKKNIAYELDELYQKYKSQYSYIGIYNLRTPILLIFDPALIKDILIKYFKNFQATEKTNNIDSKSDPLFGNHSFFLVGEAWKKKRSELTIAFSNSRIKALFPLMQEAVEKMTKYIDNESKLSEFGGFNAKDLAGRFTMSVVCSTIYNIDAHAFTSSKEQSIVKQKVDELLNVGFRFTLHHIITSIYPFLKKYYKVAFCKPEAYPFFYDMMKNAVKYRVDNKIQREDYLDHLMNLYNKKEITMDDITLHGATFLTDGYETSSIAISSALYELGRDKKVQEKLRNEILSEMPKGEDLSYDKVMDLPYLDQVLNEVLRLHIAVMYLPKVCNAPTEVDMLDGKKLYFEKDSVIYIPIRSIHLDEAYYEDPLTFKPERFDADRGRVKAYEKKGVFFPFGAGPRICVGNRFAIAQSKVALASLLRNYDVSLDKKIADKFEIPPKAFLLQYSNPFLIEFKKRA